MNNVQKVLCGVVLALCAVPQQIHAQDYAREMQRLLRSQFQSKDSDRHASFTIGYNRYQFYGVPMSGFGVGTMYPKAAAGAKTDIKELGLFGDPRTWWTSSSDADNNKASDAIFSSADSITIDLKGTRSRSLSLAATLPALFKLLTGSGSLDRSTKTTVTLTADNATNHLISWPDLDDAVNGNPPKIKASVAKHFHNQDFVITVGDIVLNNLKVHVAVTKNS